jgi:hypothetical protein
MWGFIRQQNIERYRKQLTETTDPFRRARLQTLLDEELATMHPPTIAPADVRTGIRELADADGGLEW